MTPRVHFIREELPRIREVARRRLQGGENARRVVQGISDSMDGVLRAFFADDLLAVGRHVALVAVGGYGRRELCPHSDIDLLFLCSDLRRCAPVLERLVTDLWDSGLELGHSVRTPRECLGYMKDDDVTAAALLEARFLAGSEGVMRQFQESSLDRYIKHHREAFVSAKLESLRKSIEGEGRTIYVTEPHVKEGMCCLRDVQHILWIEKMRRNVTDFADIASHGGFSFEEVRKLEEAYTFYLRVRCELHFVNSLRQDILEYDTQLEVARNLGYVKDDAQSGLERLMSDYYRHARDVRSFARYYLESKSRGKRFFSKLRHRLFASRTSFNLSVLNGHLYMPEETDPDLDPETLGERIMNIFRVAQEGNVDLSQSVREWIRRKLAEVPFDLSRSRKAHAAFLWILQKGHNTGRVLARMHEVGVLGRLIPEFDKLNALVTFDGHHQFTVDEHTLRTLRELDRIENDPDYREPEFRKVFERIPDRLPLRVALLLHDIGKAVKGSHDTKGTEAAIVICERLGLDEETTQTVEFLIYRHLAMFRYSERIDLTEDASIESFARLVGNRRNLDMLYLLTYIDVSCVGPGSWTSWKGVQLAELYGNTILHLERGSRPEDNVVEALRDAGIDKADQQAILEHCKLVDQPGYVRETIPERMLTHVNLIRRFLDCRSPQVHHEEMLGFYQITFCSQDRRHLFADLAGLLLSEGLDILSARIYSRTDGVVLDVFQVVSADDLRVPMDRRVDNLRRKIERIDTGQATVEDFIQERRRRYRRTVTVGRSLSSPTVRYLDELSRKFTVIEVKAADRPGLLYDLSVALADLGLDVQTAKVSTMVDQARDVFYVIEEGGERLSDPVRRREIEAALVRAARGRRPQEISGKEPITPQAGRE